MEVKLPWLLEKPVPSPVAKSEAVTHIEVDVDTKEKRHGDNGLILIVDSAGAQSKLLHYGTSGMRSFFQAAIIQSSPMSFPFRTYAEYITCTVLLAEQLKCVVVEHFPPDEVNDQRPLLARLFTQWTFTCSSRLFARKAPIAYTHVFTYPPITNGASNSSVFQGHVCHGDELYFLFEALRANLTAAGRRLSSNFANYWTNYAKSQDLNQPIQVPLIWPRFHNDVMKYLCFQDPIETMDNYFKDDCDFCDKIGY
ncbi:unnamed protein product [Rotaria socialis]|uniref:Carboxylesterase type B domain-containing protein n=1 Tax=Rotaria socialis TaxID=392032 RepID=A0A820UKD5_9BILA|nr:unnamed protein product [Rotaria socialis]